MSFRNENMMMNDPGSQNARVFVGNLTIPDVQKKDLESQFRKYGPIKGVSINPRGFGFVQFEDEMSANSAIKEQQGQMFFGKKLEVNLARTNPRQAPDGVRDRSPLNDGRGRMDEMNRGRMDDMNRNMDMRGPDRGRYEDRNPMNNRGGLDHNRDHMAPRNLPSLFDSRPRLEDRGSFEDSRGGRLGPDDRPRMDERGREGAWKDNYPPRGGPLDQDRGGYLPPNREKEPLFPGRDKEPLYPNREKETFFAPKDGKFGAGGPGPYPPLSGGPAAAPPAPAAGIEKTNDCEIIVVNKEQRDYAEFIERRLKQMGLTVDLLFPNKEVPIGRVLANISSRGSLYAIVVMPQNEEHRSLTLNILHGQPQEHRNMPLEDAIPLIVRDFEILMREKSGPPVAPAAVPVVPAVTTSNLPERHPESIQILLNLLADNRQLTTLQYDRIIKYLSDRREDQMKLEVGEDALTSGDPNNKKQADLQHRILNILNSRNNVQGAPAPVPHPSVTSQSGPMQSQSGGGNWSNSGPTPLLNDPTVQKALDSLMQGNLLRQISTTQASQSSALGAPPAQPLFGAYSNSGARRF